MLRKICFFYYPIVAGTTLLLATMLFYLSGGLHGHGQGGDFLLLVSSAVLYICLVWTIPLWLAMVAVLVIGKLLGRDST
jgi:hypothetical protein